ncbi:MAG TPA: S9 family peptidase [Vicinamibacterales bacterium]
MSLIDLASLARVFNPQLSPDGKTIVYHQSHADWKLDRPIWNVFRQDVGGTPRQITFSEAGEINAPGDLRWSPDGKTIMFVRASQGPPQIWLMPADGGEPKALTRHGTGVQTAGGPAPAWSPDGRTIYFASAEPQTPEERDRDRVKDDVYALDESVRQRHLWKVTVATGAEQQITSGDFSVLSFRVSHDGAHIALERGITPSEGDLAAGEAWVMNADGSNARAVTHNAIAEYEPELSPDNKSVLFLAEANARLEPYYNQTLFVVPATGGTPTALVPDLAVDAATWLPDGKSILAAVNLGIHTEFFRIDVASRRAKQLTDGKHFIVPGWTLAPGADRVVFQFDEPTRFGDVWTMPIASDAPPTRISGVFDRLDSEFALPRQERFEWKGADGTPIEGLLFLPATPRPEHGYPLVVQMHGGPKDSDKYGAGVGLFQNYFPVLTGKGYAVLRPNYRGSTGYGNAFFRGVVGGYFKHQPTDILNGIDELVKQGMVDPDRLVVMGWSAGAHLTNKLVTMTPRFKAASAGAGASDWISLYAQTDARADRTIWFAGSPWEKDAFKKYWDESPLKDVANVTTPTIFVVGDRDTRIPKEQSIEMYRALLSNGVPTHLYIAPGETHQWGGLHHLLAKANNELAWFDKYAMGRTYTWEKAPDPK